MIFTVIIGNLFGTMAGIFLVNPLARLTTLPASVLVPVLISIICTGAYAVNSSTFDIGIVVVFGALGYLMKQMGYSRSSMLIGFVLGAVLEKNLFLAVQLDGPYFFLQPVPFVLVILTIGFLGYNIWVIARHNFRLDKNGDSANGEEFAVEEDGSFANNGNRLELYFISTAGMVFIAALLIAFTYTYIPARTPVFILVPLIILTGLQVFRVRFGTRETGIAIDGQLTKALVIVAWTALLLISIIVVGHYVSIALFMFILLKMVSQKDTSPQPGR